MTGASAATAAAFALVCALAPVAAGAGDDPAAMLPPATALAPLLRLRPVARHAPGALPAPRDGSANPLRAFAPTASAHALHEDPADPAHRVELSVFVFADPLAAFGFFAALRPAECAPVARIGNGGCLGDRQGFFWQGPLFVLAEASGPAATRPADIRRALEAVAALAGPPPPRPEPLRAFSRFADTRSIVYEPRHLLGREALPPGLAGLVDGLPVFLSVGPCDTAKMTAMLEAYAADARAAGARRDQRLPDALRPGPCARPGDPGRELTRDQRGAVGAR